MDHHLRAQTLHSSIKNNCTIIFFHPDYTVGSGITPDHAPFHIDFICQFCYSIRIDYCHLKIRKI